MTPEDGVVLATSAMLHDAAMALTGDGLLGLLSTDLISETTCVDQITWENLFEEFYAEARRWDDRLLNRIMGDQKMPPHTAELTKDVVHIQRRINPEDWSVRYRKFLGEFVRRYHGRIAHEIALCGFPGSDRRPFRLREVAPHLADLAGFVARSHSMSLRSTYGYLDTKYDGHIFCRNTHPLYLMVLLRIADYIQLDAKRVNASWQGVQRLRSPVSQAEYDAHIAIQEIRSDDNDPKSLFVAATPESAATFIKIRTLLKGLQAELDASWAVLSEAFGRRVEMSDFEIGIHRITSNLDDEKQFMDRHSPSYFPIYAVFDTVGAPLLKLLIRPLYGNRPEVGIRELMQNSLDAVRELRRIRETHPELSAVPVPQQDADVLGTVNLIV